MRLGRIGGSREEGMNMVRQQGVQIGRDAVGTVITTGQSNVIDADVTATRSEEFTTGATIDVSGELANIRALLMGLQSEHARKIGRALDDAHDESSGRTAESKDELGKALDRALGYAKSASAFAVTATKLTPHLKNVVAWLGGKWTSLLTHLA
jgi:hypothetical protein